MTEEWATGLGMVERWDEFDSLSGDTVMEGGRLWL